MESARAQEEKGSTRVWLRLAARQPAAGVTSLQERTARGGCIKSETRLSQAREREHRMHRAQEGRERDHRMRACFHKVNLASPLTSTHEHCKHAFQGRNSPSWKLNCLFRSLDGWDAAFDGWILKDCEFWMENASLKRCTEELGFWLDASALLRDFSVMFFNARRTGTSICPRHTATRSLLSDREEYARQLLKVSFLNYLSYFCVYCAFVFLNMNWLVAQLESLNCFGHDNS